MLIYRDNKKTCMKKLLVVLAVLFIGILLAGCTTQPAAPVATPTPTPMPTVALTVAPTAAPTEVVIVVVKTNVTATPTATPTPLPDYVITFTQTMTITPSDSPSVPVGTKVIWTNMDPFKPHGVQAAETPTGNYFGDMNQHLIPYNGTFSATFDKAGTYQYYTLFQPQLTGKIIVS